MAHDSVDYEEDFFLWTVEQARLLRSGEFSAIDVANIAEEIESMGRSDRRAIESRLTALLTHLLKWRIQSRMRSASWSGTIGEQRRRIEKLLQESPSLPPVVDEVLTVAYSDAEGNRSKRNGIVRDRVPCRVSVYRG